MQNYFGTVCAYRFDSVIWGSLVYVANLSGSVYDSRFIVIIIGKL